MPGGRGRGRGRGSRPRRGRGGWQPPDRYYYNDYQDPYDYYHESPAGPRRGGRTRRVRRGRGGSSRGRRETRGSTERTASGTQRDVRTTEAGPPPPTSAMAVVKAPAKKQPKALFGTTCRKLFEAHVNSTFAKGGFKQTPPTDRQKRRHTMVPLTQRWVKEVEVHAPPTASGSATSPPSTKKVCPRIDFDQQRTASLYVAMRIEATLNLLSLTEEIKTRPGAELSEDEVALLLEKLTLPGPVGRSLLTQSIPQPRSFVE